MGLDESILDYKKPFKGAIVSNGIIQDELVAGLVSETK